MLRKLLKYEYKATGRLLLPLYGSLLVAALISRLCVKTGHGIYEMESSLGNIASLITMFIYGTIMAAVFIVTLFIILQRFYKNLLGDEGYLMNTLPVPVWKNICAKLIVAVTWNIISIIVSVLSIQILIYYPDMFKDLIDAIKLMWIEGLSAFGFKFIFMVCEYFLAGILYFISSILLFYASMSVGNLANKGKIMVSFGAFLIIKSIVNTILLSINMLIFQIFNFGITGLISTSILWSIVSSSIISLIYFYICNYILEKKLNLE